jgi:hypothetical protein
MLNKKNTRKKTIYISIPIIALILLVWIVVPQYFTNDRNNLSNNTEVNLPSLNLHLVFYRYGNVSSNILAWLSMIGVNTIDLSKATLKENSVVIMDASSISKGLLNNLDLLFSKFQNVKKTLIIVIQNGASKEDKFYAQATVLKILGSKNIVPLLPLDPEGEKIVCSASGKCYQPIHPAVYNADAIAFSTTPNLFVVIEKLNKVNFADVFVKLLEWSNVVSAKDMAPYFVGHKSITYGPTNMNYIGSIGWISSNTYGQVCNEITGIEEVKVDYWHRTFTAANSITYDIFYAYTQHSVKGYITSCNGNTIYHYPKRFRTTTDWQTSIYPGQVVDTWGPKNVVTSITITYSLTAGITAGVSSSGVTVEISSQAGYSVTIPSGPSFTTIDYSDPASGLIDTGTVVNEGSFVADNLSNILFTTEPSSFAYLDPTKPGGFEPMIVNQYFWVEIVNTTDPNSIGNENGVVDTASISFSVSLYSDKVSANNPTPH